MDKTVSVIGCGWLGLPLATRLLEIGYNVAGSTTNSNKLDDLTSLGIKAYLLNLPADEGLAINDLFNSETLFFNIPPGLKRGEPSDYWEKVNSFLDLLENSEFKKLIHISTTSLYPNVGGLYIEKDADKTNIHFLVEQKLAELCHAKNKQFISARCGGLMGYDRFPCKYYNADSEVSNGESGVNYIHRDDLVEILTKFITNESINGAINLCAPMHPSRKEVIIKCATKAKRDIPHFEPDVKRGKIISTGLLQKELVYNFKYPDPLAFYYDFMT
ncbi:Nucleoside-diphosphate-sugar epimerase [Spirosomataceae bacterium TFI 002]|nr:Nucleoside-diphosphate-sugar epimerase [Spirosomataceae bacterium TFI 002]